MNTEQWTQIKWSIYFKVPKFFLICNYLMISAATLGQKPDYCPENNLVLKWRKVIKSFILASKFKHFKFIQQVKSKIFKFIRCKLSFVTIDWLLAQCALRTPELCGLDFSWAITLNVVVDFKRPPQDCHLNWEWNMHYENQIHLDDVPNGKPNTMQKKASKN